MWTSNFRRRRKLISTQVRARLLQIIDARDPPLVAWATTVGARVIHVARVAPRRHLHRQFGTIFARRHALRPKQCIERRRERQQPISREREQVGRVVEVRRFHLTREHRLLVEGHAVAADGLRRPEAVAPSQRQGVLQHGASHVITEHVVEDDKRLTLLEQSPVELGRQLARPRRRAKYRHVVFVDGYGRGRQRSHRWRIPCAIDYPQRCAHRVSRTPAASQCLQRQHANHAVAFER